MDLADKLTWTKPKKFCNTEIVGKNNAYLNDFASGFWAFWKSNSDYEKTRILCFKNKDTKIGLLLIGQRS